MKTTNRKAQKAELVGLLRKYGTRSTSDLQKKMKNNLNYPTVKMLLEELEDENKVERSSYNVAVYWSIAKRKKEVKS